jgi:diketogulonate reductase-like aldo/keto reductase
LLSNLFARGELSEYGICVLDEIAEKYGKIKAQVALNWLISKHHVVTVFMAGRLAHLREDFGTMGWQLSKEDLNRLDNEFPLREISAIKEFSGQETLILK